MEPWYSTQLPEESGQVEGTAHAIYDGVENGQPQSVVDYSEMRSFAPLLSPLLSTIMQRDGNGQFFIDNSQWITHDQVDQVLCHVGQVRSFIWKANREVSSAAVWKVIQAIEHHTRMKGIPLFPALEVLYFDDEEKDWIFVSSNLWAPSLSQLHCRVTDDPMFNLRLLERMAPLRHGRLRTLNLVYSGLECPMGGPVRPNSDLGALDPDGLLTDFPDAFLECFQWLEHVVIPFFIGARGLAALARMENLKTADIRFRDVDVAIDEQEFPGVIHRGFWNLEQLTIHLRWQVCLYNTVDLLSKMQRVPLRSLTIVVAQHPAHSGPIIALDEVVSRVARLPWVQSLETFSIVAPPTPRGPWIISRHPFSVSLAPCMRSMVNLVTLKVPLDSSTALEELVYTIHILTRAMGNLKNLDLLPTGFRTLAPELPMCVLHIIAENCKNLQSLAIDVSGELTEEFMMEEKSCHGENCPLKLLKVGRAYVHDRVLVTRCLLRHFPLIEKVESLDPATLIPSVQSWAAT